MIGFSDLTSVAIVRYLLTGTIETAITRGDMKAFFDALRYGTVPVVSASDYFVQDVRQKAQEGLDQLGAHSDSGVGGPLPIAEIERLLEPFAEWFALYELVVMPVASGHGQLVEAAAALDDIARLEGEGILMLMPTHQFGRGVRAVAAGRGADEAFRRQGEWPGLILMRRVGRDESVDPAWRRPVEVSEIESHFFNLEEGAHRVVEIARILNRPAEDQLLRARNELTRPIGFSRVTDWLKARAKRATSERRLALMGIVVSAVGVVFSVYACSPADENAGLLDSSAGEVLVSQPPGAGR